MKKIQSLIMSVACVVVFLATACNNSNRSETTDSLAVADVDTLTDGSDADAKVAVCDISSTKADTSGSGKATFTQSEDGTVSLNVTVEFPKMANKSVAVHIHEHGDCGDMGKGAHGHWNPTEENHGKWGSGAFHSGDIGNIELDANGKGQHTMTSKDRWSIGGDAKTDILKRAIIVHSGVDDYTTQPTGNAGSRIGCGVIVAQ